MVCIVLSHTIFIGQRLGNNMIYGFEMVGHYSKDFRSINVQENMINHYHA